MEVPKNGICLMENPVEMDDFGDIWGYPHFRKPPFGALPPNIQCSPNHTLVW